MDARWLEDDDYLNRCLSGECLIGDDFTQEDLDLWFSIESQAYAEWDLVATSIDKENNYYALNKRHVFKKLPVRYWDDVLSYGGANCDELIPIKNQLGTITVLEPGKRFWGSQLDGKPLTYVMPESSGKMPFNDDSFDLITCFGALHHVPNVSYIVHEMSRVLRKGGYCVIREPSTSMGDWRFKRSFATPCERGIPVALMKEFIQQSECKLISVSACCFQPLLKAAMKCKLHLAGNSFLVHIDAFLSGLFRHRQVYNPRNFMSKFQPGSYFYVLTK